MIDSLPFQPGGSNVARWKSRNSKTSTQDQAGFLITVEKILCVPLCNPLSPLCLNFNSYTKIRKYFKLTHTKMKRLILLFLFANVYLIAYNQIIKGTILDQKTHEIIINASVYFNGSFVGTFSDQNGDFELNVSHFSSSPLTISALGYYSVTLTDFSPGKPLIVYLNPKAYEIEEVVIKAKSFARERARNLKLFRENFLGTTANAGSCKIINEDDITLLLENDTLKAFSSKPLRIDNRGLGYKTTYYLDKFWVSGKRRAFFISGNMIFNEDLVSDKSKTEFYETRRKQTYLGSRMHFFRALWNNDLESAGYTVKNLGNINISYKNFIIQTDSLTKHFNYTGMLGIEDHMGLTTSWVIFVKDYVSFDKRGYFDPFAISWDGAMAVKRIADWLPYEYSMK